METRPPPYPLAFNGPPGITGWPRWLLFSPGARLAYFAFLLYTLGGTITHLVVVLGWADKAADPLLRALGMLSLQVLPPLLGYLLVVRLLEQRRPQELRPRAGLLLAGLGAGAALMSLVVGILWLFGSYRVLGTQDPPNWLADVLVVGVGAGIGEEIVCRAALFRIVEEGLGTWWALLISAAFFGAAHIFNPAATWWSSAAIAIEAGLLFALLYHATRSLWACTGMHAAWNVMQGTFYGIPVSGTDAHGWLVSVRRGPDWLSGGAFGAEASVVALLVCCGASVALLLIARRRYAFVPPSWRRRVPAAAASPPLSPLAG